MIIKNGLVFDVEKGFVQKDLAFLDGIILEKNPVGDEEYDADGLYVLPGFIDIHTHGCAGYDFSNGNEDELHHIAAYLKGVGVTGFCPTSMTLPIEMLEKAYKVVKSFESAEDEAEILGINMEGPFINSDKLGAQNPNHVKTANLEDFKRLTDASGGKITLVTIAPEVPGNMSVINEMTKEVNVSIGHTTANYDISAKAFANGANHVTHLCNAMPAFAHRDPSVFGAAADNEKVYVELIADGVHIHPSMIRTAVKAFGADRICLISDSCEACGMEDGTYLLGGLEVKKRGNRAELKDGTLAGSVTNVADGFRNVVKYGIRIEDAVKMVTVNPAKSIGRFDCVGDLSAGKRADMILMNKELELIKVF